MVFLRGDGEAEGEEEVKERRKMKRERKKKRLAPFNLVLHTPLVFLDTFCELEHTGSNITLDD